MSISDRILLDLDLGFYTSGTNAQSYVISIDLHSIDFENLGMTFRCALYRLSSINPRPQYEVQRSRG